MVCDARACDVRYSCCCCCCLLLILLLAPIAAAAAGLVGSSSHALARTCRVCSRGSNQGSRRPVPARALDGIGSGEQVCHGLHADWLRTPPTTSIAAPVPRVISRLQFAGVHRPGAVPGDVMMVTRRDFQVVRGRFSPRSAVHMPVATQKLRTVRGQRLTDVVILGATQDLRGVALDIRFHVSMSQAGRMAGSTSKLTKNLAYASGKLWVCRMTLIPLIFVSFGTCIYRPMSWLVENPSIYLISL